MKRFLNKIWGYRLYFIVVGLLFAIGFVCGRAFAEKYEEAPAATPVVVAETKQHIEAGNTDAENIEPTPNNEIIVTATAYCPCMQCCGKTDGITATGTKATAGRTVAVDPSIIPYGTKLIINGNTYIAEDCGGAIKGANRIDIFFNTHEEALQFGRQTVVATLEI